MWKRAKDFNLCALQGERESKEGGGWGGKLRVWVKYVKRVQVGSIYMKSKRRPWRGPPNLQTAMAVWSHRSGEPQVPQSAEASTRF